MKKIWRGFDLLSENDQDLCLKEIIGYFQSERGEVIGVIAAGQILDFFLEKIGPLIYNKAVDEAKDLLKKQCENWDFEFELLKKPARGRETRPGKQ